MRQVIALPPELWQEMVDHAISVPDVEVCGLLGARNNVLTSIYPVTNIDKEKERRFLMSPQEQIDAMRTMRERSEIMAGIYHSHPVSVAVPSKTDRDLAAYPDVYYFIISLVGPVPEIRCYLLENQSFKEITINVSSDSTSSA
jgi:proteasome lid subunit RPN8/RPN11